MKEKAKQEPVFNADWININEAFRNELQVALKRFIVNFRNKPDEYEKAFKSLELYLNKKAQITPREYKYFINWWAYEKHGHLGPGKLFAKEILDTDFIEYSAFRQKIIEGGEPPFWFNDAANDFWVPKHLKSPIDEQNETNGEKPITLADLENHFNINTIQDVYSYFKKGLVDRKHLTNDELLSYLYYAFDRKEIPEKKFVLKDVTSKEKIYKLFGDYFRGPALKPKGKKPEYVRLLTDYFVGFNYNTVFNNFS